MAKLSAISTPSLTFDEGAAASTPASGDVVLYAKTDGLLYSKDDAGTETLVSGGSGGGGGYTELDYVEFTSNVSPTATTEGGADTVVTGSSVAYDGSTTVVIEFYTPVCRASNAAGATMTFVLYDGASSIGKIAQIGQGTTQGNEYKVVHAHRRITPSNASHTYSIRAYVSTGTGIVGAGTGGSGNNVPGFIRITSV